MIAAARGFHKREDKPFWWAHFHRLDNPIDEWADTSGVFIVESAEIEEDWRDPQGRERKPRRRLRLRGGLESGDLGQGLLAMYEDPAPATLDHHSNGRACNAVKVDECRRPCRADRDRHHRNQSADGRTASSPSCPSRSAPSEPVRHDRSEARHQLRRRRSQSRAAAAARNRCIDILRRRPPRTRAGQALPRSGRRHRRHHRCAARSRPLLSRCARAPRDAARPIPRRG